MVAPCHLYNVFTPQLGFENLMLLLPRKLFPDAKIFSITTGAAVMKMNYEFGFRPVPFSELTDDPEFWKGCEGCRHFHILQDREYRMCLCTGLLYDPKEHLTIHHPDEA